MAAIDRLGGDKRLIDWWSLLHFLGFAALLAFVTWGLSLTAALRLDAVSALLVAVGFGVLWEGAERMRERTTAALAGKPVAHEPWSNRAFDVVVDTAGGMLGWALMRWAIG